MFHWRATDGEGRCTILPLTSSIGGDLSDSPSTAHRKRPRDPPAFGNQCLSKRARLPHCHGCAVSLGFLGPKSCACPTAARLRPPRSPPRHRARSSGPSIAGALVWCGGPGVTQPPEGIALEHQCRPAAISADDLIGGGQWRRWRYQRRRRLRRLRPNSDRRKRLLPARSAIMRCIHVT